MGTQRSWHIPSAFDTIAVAYATSTDLMYVLSSSKKSSSFKLKSECSLLEDTNTVPLSVFAIPVGPGIFEIVLVFNPPRT